MKKIIPIILFTIYGLGLKAQPIINDWYKLDRIGSIFINVIPTDTCYYINGLVRSNNPGVVWDATFIKMNFDGEIELFNIISNDTVSINVHGGQNFVKTLDGNFATLAHIHDYFLFIKYAPNGDTIFTKIIYDFEAIDYRAFKAIAIIQMPDSSFSCLGQLENLLLSTPMNQVGNSVFFNLDKNGEMNFYKIYPTNASGFNHFEVFDFVKTNEGYVISGYINGFNGSFSTSNFHVRVIKTDDLGNVLQTYTDTETQWNSQSYGLTQVSDGGYLYGGYSGYYITSEKLTAHIVRLDENLNKIWDKKYGIETAGSMVMIREIIPLNNGNYIAAGHQYSTSDTMVVAWLFEFNIEGDMIWQSHFSYVPRITHNFPEHYFYDVKETKDNGFVMVGQAIDYQAIFEGIPGAFGYVVKSDSLGCLVPGCREVEPIDTLPDGTPKDSLNSQIKTKLYPNPASQFLYIYFSDNDFSENTQLAVYDINGKEIQKWEVHTNQHTYIYDVSTLANGTYIIKVIKKGKIKSEPNEKFVVLKNG